MKPRKIFYSWQSDSPENINRHFISKAIIAAIKRLNADDAEVDNAPRSVIQFDKDTLNVPGSPAITETIFSKIKGCAVFVADLTFVGQSKLELGRDDGARQMPNPNVLIEHGYALSCHTELAIVAVVNTAFGELGKYGEHLPFNLRHLRHPITYNLGPNASATERESVFQQLVNILVVALRTRLEDYSPDGQSGFELWAVPKFQHGGAGFGSEFQIQCGVKNLGEKTADQLKVKITHPSNQPMLNFDKRWRETRRDNGHENVVIEGKTEEVLHQDDELGIALATLQFVVATAPPPKLEKSFVYSGGEYAFTLALSTRDQKPAKFTVEFTAEEIASRQIKRIASK